MVFFERSREDVHQVTSNLCQVHCGLVCCKQSQPPTPPPKHAQDMLLTGKCHILVAPNGGSTYTYTPTAMCANTAVPTASLGSLAASL